MDGEPWETQIRLLGRITESEHQFLLKALQGRCSRVNCIHDDKRWHLLDPYVYVLHKWMSVDDLNYLIQKKALSLPCYHIRDELFANFLRYVYPITPFVNIDEFYAQNLENDSLQPENRGSILLTQSVLFAGSQFTDLSTLRDLGFHSRGEACKHFYRNVRTLQHLGVKEDTCSQISACLLMNVSQSYAAEEVNPQYWIDQAVSLAFRIGLNRQDPERLTNSSLNRLQRRLWWSCYTKDRLSAFPNLQRSRILDTEYDIPLLEFQDFEGAILHPKVKAFAKDFVFEYGALVKTSIQLTTLCRVVGRVVETLPITGWLQSVRDQASRSSEKRPLRAAQKARREELTSWQRSLSIREEDSELASLGLSEYPSEGRLETIHVLFLRIVYAVCLCLTCNWPNTSNEANMTDHGCQQEKSPKRVVRETPLAHSMGSLTRLVHEVLQEDLFYYLPVETTAFINTAMMLDSPRISVSKGSRVMKDIRGLRALTVARRILGARFEKQVNGYEGVQSPSKEFACTQSEVDDMNDGFIKQDNASLHLMQAPTPSFKGISIPVD